MTEKRTPIFTFTQRIGNTNFTVRAYCDDDIAVTYEDKLLELSVTDAITMQEFKKRNNRFNEQIILLQAQVISLQQRER